MRSPTDIDRDRLVRVGEALYGPRWQSDLARALEVNDRRVRAWLLAERTIPPGVWLDLAKLASGRAAVLDALAAELRRSAARSRADLAPPLDPAAEPRGVGRARR